MLPVRIEPDRQCRLWINSPAHKDFQSAASALIVSALALPVCVMVLSPQAFSSDSAGLVPLIVLVATVAAAVSRHGWDNAVLQGVSAWPGRPSRFRRSGCRIRNAVILLAQSVPGARFRGRVGPNRETPPRGLI